MRLYPIQPPPEDHPAPSERLEFAVHIAYMIAIAVTLVLGLFVF